MSMNNIIYKEFLAETDWPLADAIYQAFLEEYPTLSYQVGNDVFLHSDAKRLEIIGLWVKDTIILGWDNLRIERNNLLAETDWTQVPDAQVDAPVWAEYRQALRDLPQNTVDPRNPIWPTPPVLGPTE
jgi:hypothetical protein